MVQASAPTSMDNHGVGSTLPEEMLVEIFSRLPAKSVGRLHCLSRSWAATLRSPPFVNLHFHQANSTPKLFLTTARLDLDDPYRDHRRFQILTKPCHGLVLLRRPPLIGHYVFNPSTGELLRLPDRGECHKRSNVAYGLGYSPTTMEHKVVRVFFSQSSPCCEVFSLEVSTRWRAIDQKPTSCAPPAPAAVFCDGYLHFLLGQQGGSGTSSSIVTFHVSDETFGSLRTPPSAHSSAQDDLPPPLELTVLDRCLCLCVSRDLPWNGGGGGDDPYCIWRLACREAAGGRWEKFYSVREPRLQLHWVSPLEVYHASNGRKKIVFAKQEGVLAYNLDDGGDPEMLDSSAGGTATISSAAVGLLEESLVSLGRTSQGLVQDNDGDGIIITVLLFLRRLRNSYFSVASFTV